MSAGERLHCTWSIGSGVEDHARVYEFSEFAVRCFVACLDSLGRVSDTTLSNSCTFAKAHPVSRKACTPDPEIRCTTRLSGNPRQ